MKFKGFTLIEIMVAISVMIIGILGVYALVPHIISLSGANTDRFRAAQLAREGLELVRNIRDTNSLEGVAWDEGLTNCSGGCEIDYNDSAPVTYGDRYLKIDSDGFYNYENGQETKFKRKIIITPNSNVLDVKVQIIWPGKDSPFEVEESLYNWR